MQSNISRIKKLEVLNTRI